MATTQSTQLVNVDLPNVFLEPIDAGTDTHAFNFVTSSNTNGTAVELVRAPKGSRFQIGVLQSGALGTSVTIAIGTLADPDRFLAATAHATAGQVVFYGNAASAVNAYEELTEETAIYLTVGGANADDSIEVQGLIKFVLAQ